jgi:hypothetical protein
MPFVETVKLFKKTDENTLVMFLVGDLPFPFHDRAGCLNVKKEINIEEGTGWLRQL